MLFTLVYITLLLIPYIGLLSCKYTLREERDLLRFFKNADIWKESSWEFLEAYKKKLPERLGLTKDADKITTGLQTVSAVTHILAFVLCFILSDIATTNVLAVTTVVHGVFFHWLTARGRNDLSIKSEDYKQILIDIEQLIENKKPLWHKHKWLQDVERGDMLHFGLLTKTHLSNATGESVIDFVMMCGNPPQEYRFPAFFLGIKDDPYVDVLVVGSPFENDEIYELRHSNNIENVRRDKDDRYNNALIFTVHVQYLRLFTAEEFTDEEAAIEKSRALKDQMDKPVGERQVFFGFDADMLQNLKLDDNLCSGYGDFEQERYDTFLSEANNETTPAEEKREAFYREKHGLLPKKSMDDRALGYTQPDF